MKRKTRFIMVLGILILCISISAAAYVQVVSTTLYINQHTSRTKTLYDCTNKIQVTGWVAPAKTSDNKDSGIYAESKVYYNIKKDGAINTKVKEYLAEGNESVNFVYNCGNADDDFFLEINPKGAGTKDAMQKEYYMINFVR